MNAIAGAEVIARLLRILPCAHPVEQPAIGRIVDRDAELLVAARDIFGLLGLDITLDRAEQDCRADRPRREAVIIVDRLPRRIDPPFQRDDGVRETLADIMTVKARSEERRVGTKGVSTCRSRWCPYH